MSKKFSLSGIGAASVLALSLLASPAVAAVGDDLHGITSNDAVVERHLIDDVETHAATNPSNDVSEYQVARLVSLFGR